MKISDFLEILPQYLPTLEEDWLEQSLDLELMQKSINRIDECTEGEIQLVEVVYDLCEMFDIVLQKIRMGELN